MHLHETIWIIFGFVLIISELLLNGFIIVFFGTSAVLTGILLWVGWLPADNGIPLFFFIGATVIQILTLRKFLKGIFLGNLDENSSELDNDFVGKNAVVAEDFSKQPDSAGSFHGKIFFRGTHWAAVASSPLESGASVTIDKRKGSTLIVRNF
jgi:inner membrane protein